MCFYYFPVLSFPFSLFYFYSFISTFLYPTANTQQNTNRIWFLGRFVYFIVCQPWVSFSFPSFFIFFFSISFPSFSNVRIRDPDHVGESKRRKEREKQGRRWKKKVRKRKGNKKKSNEKSKTKSIYFILFTIIIFY